MKKPLLLLIPVLSLTACKELQPVLDQVKPVLQEQMGQPGGISSAQMAEAIKQALDQGLGDSVGLLGKAQGFALSDLYRIAMPQQLEKPATILRQLGQGDRVDEFEARLNLAAEQSVAKARPIFTAAVKGMTISDALNIMQGPDNAATRYFQGRTENSLRQAFTPIIQKATAETGLTSSYKKLSDKIRIYAPAYASSLVDIDDYVLDKAMFALFDRIAVEEKLIREQPLKRTTELMKTVFGHFDKR
jgi:hypothetical protein